MDENLARLPEAHRQTLLRHGAIVSEKDTFMGCVKYMLPNNKVFAFEYVDDNERGLGPIINRMIDDATLDKIYHARLRFRLAA